MKSKNWRLALLLVFIAVFSGVSVMFIVLVAFTPKDLEASSSPEFVPINTETSIDERSVQAEITGGGQRQIKAKVSGVVTYLGLLPNSNVKDGDSLLEIDGRPITFIYAPVPPYQNVDPHTIWIDSEKTTITDIKISVGDEIMEGEELFSVSKKIDSAKIVNMPKDLVKGERLIDINGEKIPVDKDGVVKGDDSLMKLQRVYGKGSEENSNRINVNLILKTPTEISVVTPNAIVTDDSGASCVVFDNKTYAVSVVASELGRSFIKFNDENSLKQVLFSPNKNTKCK